MLVFPQEKERIIEVNQVEDSLYFEEREESNSNKVTADFLQYTV